MTLFLVGHGRPDL